MPGHMCGGQRIIFRSHHHASSAPRVPETESRSSGLMTSELTMSKYVSGGCMSSLSVLNAHK